MAQINDLLTGTAARVEETSKALRTINVDSAGNVISSPIRGTGKNLRTDGGTEERDGVAILLPGTAASRIGGTVTDPLRTDPTGTTTQPVSGTVGALLRVGADPVAPTNPVPVAFATRQPVSVDFPPTLQVGFGAAQPVNFGGTAQPVSFGGTAQPVSVIDPAPFDGYVASIDVVPATTVASGTVYFALKAGARTVYIRRFDLQMGFTGTAAASRSSYEIVRFTAGTPSGGTSVATAKKISTSAASNSTALVAPAGLTMTGAAYDTGPIHRVASGNQLAVSTTQDVVFTDELVLAPNEGIVIRANGAVVAGSFLTGSLGWYER